MHDSLVEIKSINKRMMDEHPFENIHSREVMEKVLPPYLAMSLAFPHLQAGSQAAGILSAIRKNADVDVRFEITSVVGNFLSWDETGGAFLLERNGKSALPEILKTRTWFHANILRQDIERITESKAHADFSGPTGGYLTELLEDLGSECHLKRCATMVAFESHAQTMIDGLWTSLIRIYRVQADSLTYFRIHVGGDDPAEKYHTEVTERMIQLLVPGDSVTEFNQLYEAALKKNLNWCKAVIGTTHADSMQQEFCL